MPRPSINGRAKIRLIEVNGRDTDVGISRTGESEKANSATRNRNLLLRVMNTFSRKIVGWSIDNAQDSALVVNALDMTIKNQQPPAGGIVHADHEVQFASWAFTNKIRRRLRQEHDSEASPVVR